MIRRGPGERQVLHFANGDVIDAKPLPIEGANDAQMLTVMVVAKIPTRLQSTHQRLNGSFSDLQNSEDTSLHDLVRSIRRVRVLALSFRSRPESKRRITAGTWRSTARGALDHDDSVKIKSRLGHLVGGDARRTVWNSLDVSGGWRMWVREAAADVSQNTLGRNAIPLTLSGRRRRCSR